MEHYIAYPDSRKLVPTAHIRGVWAVHNQRLETSGDPSPLPHEEGMRHWVVTHTPTGKRAGWNLTFQESKSLCEHYATHLGEDWGLAEVGDSEEREALGVLRQWILSSKIT